MQQLIYVSTASRAIAGGEVFDIVQKSALRNVERGITGFLFFLDGLFIQYIEGPDAALDDLLHDLARDSRHHSIEILGRRECEQRSFPNWKMKRLQASNGTQPAGEMVEHMRALGVPADLARAVERYLAVRQA